MSEGCGNELGSRLEIELLLPDYLLIGAQRSGTSSLYGYLVQHPCVGRAATKELHYFDINFSKGLDWYSTQFLRGARFYVKRFFRRPFVIGEASPYYLFHPHAPRRIRKVLPGVKLVALLRNPVERAYSHYHHEVRKGCESLTFEDAIEAEDRRLKGELEKLQADEDYYSLSHQHHSYLSRGVYADQLKLWMELFDRGQLLILQSEHFFKDPGPVCLTVCEFLGIPAWTPDTFPRHNRGAYEKMRPSTRARLSAHFQRHNELLYDLLGTRFDWQ